jgi:hypothetical protein
MTRLGMTLAAFSLLVAGGCVSTGPAEVSHRHVPGTTMHEHCKSTGPAASKEATGMPHCPMMKRGPPPADAAHEHTDK